MTSERSFGRREAGLGSPSAGPPRASVAWGSSRAAGGQRSIPGSRIEGRQPPPAGPLGWCSRGASPPVRGMRRGSRPPRGGLLGGDSPPIGREMNGRRRSRGRTQQPHCVHGAEPHCSQGAGSWDEAGAAAEALAVAVVAAAEEGAPAAVAVALGTRLAEEWRRKSETEEGRTRGQRPEGPARGASWWLCGCPWA